MHSSIYIFIISISLVLASPLITLPLVKLGGRVDEIETLGTTVVHLKHASHAARRLALMSGLDEILGQDGSTSSHPESHASPHGARLDIEGNDIGYLVNMTIGSHSQSFRMLVDAGSADMWVPGDGCQGENGGGCGPHPHLGPRSSSTFKDTRRAWYTSYGSGSASGTIVRDRVRFAGFSLEHTFGVARNESRSFIEKDIPLDGVLGCAKSNISMQGVPTLVESLQSAGMIEKNIISYKISRRSDGKNDGEITLGGMDPTKYDPSTLVRLRNVNRLGFWAASLDALKINGKHIKLGKEKECILDTGSANAHLGPGRGEFSFFQRTSNLDRLQDAAIIHRSIPGSAFNSSLSSWTVPCRTKTIMTFYFGGRPFPVKPSDLAFLPVDNPKGACTSAIVGNGGGEGTWLLGDTVIKNIYLSTDQDRDELAMARLT